MSTTASRVQKAAEDFNATDPSGMELMSIFQWMKKKAALTNAQFDIAKKAAARVVEAPAEKLFRSHSDNAAQHPRDRQLGFFYGYMAAYTQDEKDKNDQKKGRVSETKGLMLPVIDRLDLAWRDGLRVIRSMPLCVDAGRVELDYIRATASPLRYGGDDMLFAILFSLPLAQSLSSRFVSGKEETPIAIPFSRGLFLGHASRHLPQDAEDLMVVWKAKRTSSFGIMRTSMDVTDSLTAGAGIILNKAIGFRDFKPWHQRAYNMLDPFRDDEFRRGRLQEGLDAYSLGPEYKERMTDFAQWKWGEVANRITNAVDILYAHLEKPSPEPEVPALPREPGSKMPSLR